MAANHEPQATEQFFGAAVLQKLLDQKTFYLPVACDWKHCFLNFNFL